MFSNFFRALYTCFLVLVSLSCLGQSLKINELMVSNSLVNDQFDESLPWLEIMNISDDTVLLSDYALTTDTMNISQFPLPPTRLAPDERWVVWFDSSKSTDDPTHLNLDIDDSVEVLAIVQQYSGCVEDLVVRDDFPGVNESLIGFPDGTGLRYYAKWELATPGAANRDPGIWRRVNTHAAFSGRDSSPDASVVHNDTIWVLGGYRYDDGIWYSKSDVWKSGDAVHWEEVNSDPPYDPYCAFVSFKGNIWAFGPVTYRSIDGNIWEEVDTNVYLGDVRAAVFGDRIIVIDGRTVLSSTDGMHWDVVIADAPWEERSWPGFGVMNNRLYFLGGGINYNTGLDYYYRDVWVSDDAVQWTLLTDHAPFQDAYWVNFEFHAGRIWALGGWNYYNLYDEYGGNIDDVWVSSNGVDWEKISTDFGWQPRHAILSFVLDGNLYISSGYGTMGLSTLYNDVWKFNGLPQQISVGDSIVVKTYGDESFQLSASVDSGLPLSFNTADPQVALAENDAIRIVNAGETTVSLFQAGDGFFAPVEMQIPLVVKKKLITVNAGDHTIFFGDPIPDPVISFEGLVSDDDKSVIDELPLISGPPPYSPAGTYSFAMSGGQDNNYELNPIVKGSLQISTYGENPFHLFPIPARDFVTVVCEGIDQSPATFELLTQYGTVLKEAKFSGNQYLYRLDISDLSPGMYIYRFTGKDGKQLGRLIVGN